MIVVKNRTLEGWIKKSFRFPSQNPYQLLLYNFQALGKLDYKLSSEWEVIKDQLDDIKNIEKVDEISFLASLWVIAGYEFIRVLKKIDTRPEVKKVYELFRRVRIPMVKFETPKTRNKPDYPSDFGIAHIALGRGTNELGWAISHEKFVSRDELANALYNLYP
ncbi:MAG: hypothetical protein JWP09_439 [Candidatus Taylorbacteria bacterium]|nr:hypothetical protein [Candidatus Taylorbacteria bacterium]